MLNQKTFGTCVKFAVDGRQIMGLIYHKIREAKSSIWIANYDLDPDLCLIRESDHQKSWQPTARAGWQRARTRPPGRGAMHVGDVVALRAAPARQPTAVASESTVSQP